MVNRAIVLDCQIRQGTKNGMRGIIKTSTAALMLISMSGNVWATTAESAVCASREDIFAVQAAAVQQKLMVAAFSCQATQLYNRFVTTYQKDLQASDLALQNFFRHLYGQAGIANYHSFKTRLANMSSIRSVHDTQGYCADALATFDAAFINRKSLPVFLASQTTTADNAFPRCQVLTASTNNTLSRR
jgi:hypothetical protein